VPSLTRNVIANYAGGAWTALLSIICTPIYLKLLGIEAYGLIGFYAVLTSILGIFDFGIGVTTNRELARLSTTNESAAAQRDTVRTLELIYWGVAILAGGMVLVLAPYISRFWIKSQALNSGSILKALQLMAFTVALQFPINLYQGGLMGLQRQVLVNGLLILHGTIRSLGVIFVLWVSPAISTFFEWQAVLSLVGSIILACALWRCLPRSSERPHFRTAVLRATWRYAAAIFANSLIVVGLLQLDKIILSRVLTLEMFGYYSLAVTVASGIWMIVVPFNGATFPRLVQLYELGHAEKLRTFFHKASQMLSVILLPASAILILFSRQVLSLWLHDPSAVEHCHLLVSLLVLGITLNGISSLPGYSASAFGRPQLTTYTNAAQAVVVIPLMIIMIKWMQGIGAASAWVVLNSTYVVIMVPIFFHRFLREEKWNWYSRDIGVPAFTSFMICLLARVVVPSTGTPLIIFVYLTATAIISVVGTGLALPHVQDAVRSGCRAFSARLLSSRLVRAR
jgi:O-antigen/teichoic acid export membrane protein